MSISYLSSMGKATVEVILVDPVLEIANPEGFDLLQGTGLVIGSGSYGSAGGCERGGGSGGSDSGGGRGSCRRGGPEVGVGSLHRTIRLA